MSGGRIDRETEHFILHELPFTRAVCYLHAHWFRKPHVWTIGLEAAGNGEIARKVDTLLERLIASDS